MQFMKHEINSYWCNGVVTCQCNSICNHTQYPNPKTICFHPCATTDFWLRKYHYLAEEKNMW